MTKVEILKPFHWDGVEYAPHKTQMQDGKLAPRWVEIDKPGLVDWGLSVGALRREGDPDATPQPVIVEAAEVLSEPVEQPRTRRGNTGGNA